MYGGGVFTFENSSMGIISPGTPNGVDFLPYFDLILSTALWPLLPSEQKKRNYDNSKRAPYSELWPFMGCLCPDFTAIIAWRPCEAPGETWALY
jgi:hypothetical protein